MSTNCQGVNRRGEACSMPPLQGTAWCWAHSPEKAAERAAARRKGGQLRQAPAAPVGAPPSLRSVAELQAVIEQAAGELLSLPRSVAKARAIGGLVTVAGKLLEVGELEQRLAALEARLAGEETRTLEAI